jgi:hypothetical protein
VFRAEPVHNAFGDGSSHWCAEAQLIQILFLKVIFPAKGWGGLHAAAVGWCMHMVHLVSSAVRASTAPFCTQLLG